MVQIAAGEGALFTGRLSLDDHPWLADHVVMDTILFPGTGYLELALHAAAQTDTPTIEELTLAAPLVINQPQAVHLQVSVDAADDLGHRTISIYSQPETSNGTQTDWTLHATGTLTNEPPTLEIDTTALTEQPWPPPHAQPINPDDAYTRLAEHGYEYGPAFQNIRAAYTTDNELYAEITLNDEHTPTAPNYHLHPALTDAALQTSVASPKSMASAWTNTRVYSRGASTARMWVGKRPDGQLGPVVLWDAAGQPDRLDRPRWAQRSGGSSCRRQWNRARSAVRDRMEAGFAARGARHSTRGSPQPGGRPRDGTAGSDRSRSRPPF